MVKRIGTARRKTRQLLSLKHREKGKLPLRRYLQSFQAGDHVAISIQPNMPEGMPFRRYAGRIGIVTGMQGDCYLVQVRDGRKLKTLIIHPVHLKKHAEG